LLYGAGIQNKVLEAMACATPVITSPGAAASLSAKNGRDFLVASDPESFAREILDLLADDSRRNELGRAGRVYAETHHNWDEIGSLLESAYQKAIAGGKLHRARRTSPKAVSKSGALFPL
jgi:glycosyltransferase involved in cell wall biosynthesis